MARILFVTMLVAVLAVGTLGLSSTGAAARIDRLFREFQEEYGRTYGSAEETEARKRIFAENLLAADEQTARNPYATFGVNRFSDMSAAEFKKFLGDMPGDLGLPPPKRLYDRSAITKGAGIDWRTKGAVTPVKNQGHCGSCWAFSAVGNIEGQWFLAGHPLTALSEQMLVSCDEEDSGCNGGLAPNAYQWLIDNRKGWIAESNDYPYVSGSGQEPKCNKSITEESTHGRGATIKSFKALPHDEEQMGEFVLRRGPISVSIDASSIKSYKSGIVTNCPSVHTNHAVLAVGFDDNNVPPYWIIKNSWSKIFGEDGYIRIEKGKDMCLISFRPSCVDI